MAADAGSTAAQLTDSPVATSALDRLTRVIARLIAAGATTYLCLLMPTIVGQYSRLQPWYTPVFFTAVFGPALLLWFFAFRGSVTQIRRTVTVLAAAYLLAQLLWVPAFEGPRLAVSGGTWLSYFPGLITLATAVAWRTWAVIAYLVTCASLAQVISYESRIDHGVVPLLPDIVFGIMFCGIFTVTAMLVVRTGRILDATRAQAEAQAAAAAASAARSVERERFDALIHDDVMSTLLAAARAGNSGSLSSQARSALGRLESLRSGLGDAEPLNNNSFESYLRSALTKIDENIVVRRGGDEKIEVPMDTARALTACAVEALRNSARHARHATRAVDLTIVDRTVSIVVADDGPGFDPSRIPPHRLGLAVSVRGRMRQLSGGHATVHSSPGKGTTVALVWKAPA